MQLTTMYSGNVKLFMSFQALAFKIPIFPRLTYINFTILKKEKKKKKHILILCGLILLFLYGVEERPKANTNMQFLLIVDIYIYGLFECYKFNTYCGRSKFAYEPKII